MTVPLPCPFCGAVPRVGPERPEVDGNAFAYVACLNNDCPAMPSVDDGDEVADDRGSDGYKELAIKRWNRRA